MKVALISNLVTDDFQANQRRILEFASEAVELGARMIVFPEAAATGLVNTGEPEHDLQIAEAIPGPRNEQWREFAKEHETYFAAGLLEKEDGRMYDSGVLFDPQGELILHYRRIHPGWRWPDDDPQIYCTGEALPVVETDIGKVGMLICGDLWSDGVAARFKEQQPDYLLHLLARSVDAKDVSKTWVEELPNYCQRWAETGAAILAVNLYEGDDKDASIGGAWCFARDGGIINSLPVLQEGILLVDLPD